MAHKVIYFLLILYSSVVHTCKTHKKCQDCITDPKNTCVWCASISDIETRCRPENSYDASWCPGHIHIPENASIAISEIYNRNFSSKSDDIVQIKPQSYNVKLRPGQPIDFSFSFQAAKNYPVDLYILLDASSTMETIKKDLSSHSYEIYKAIHDMTNNVQMGFGTYIDKNIQPFIENINSDKAYSFKNHLNLTSNYKAFESIVAKTEFSTNYDPPEGGFDALAQVLACDVGWRDKSRRIIVFITDGSHHVVGDGRNAGIFKPHDGKCYTNEQGIYTEELNMDYPSIGMIDSLASEKETIIIFILNNFETNRVQNVEPWYEGLTQVIQNSKQTVLGQGQGIVKQLKKSYMEFSQNILLKATVKSGYRSKYDITFHPNCIKSDSDECKIRIGESQEFRGTITLSEYYGNGKDIIDISVIEGINEKLTLNVEVVKCACEELQEHNSIHCYGQTLQCGICICDPKTSYGRQCMCSKDKNTETADDSQCRASNVSKICSGNGRCKCGHCICAKNYFGKFCECSRESCPGYRINSKGDEEEVCNGHGDCECSSVAKKATCSCHKGWSHRPGEQFSDCTCSEATDLCKQNNKNEVCNNRGSCSCNACKCDSIASWDYRIKQNDLCVVEPCPDCHSLQCSAIINCVQCHLDSDKCASACDGIELEKKYDILPENSNTEWKECKRQKVDLGCYTNFVYRYDDDKYRILLQMEKDKNCTESYYMFGGILLATILLVGIFTLLAWKVITYYNDLREYRKFEVEHKNELGNPSINPLYDAPTTTFRNPAFEGFTK